LPVFFYLSTEGGAVRGKGDGGAAPAATGRDLALTWCWRVFPATGNLSPKLWTLGEMRMSGAGPMNWAAGVHAELGGEARFRPRGGGEETRGSA